MLREAQGGVDVAAREADLLERLEEEEKRVAALENELARSTGSRTARLWDTDSGRQVALLRRDDLIDWAAFSPDGAKVLVASHDGTIWIFPVYRSTAALLSTGLVSANYLRQCFPQPCPGQAAYATRPRTR